MFSNIGSKLKVLAKILCYVGISLSLIIGSVIMVLGGANGGLAFVIGLLTIVGGSLASWIGSFWAYGFGTLVENSDIIAEKVKKCSCEKTDDNTKI